MKLKIPEDYYSNLSCYEEFVLKTNLLGKNVYDKDVLRKLHKAGKYYWFVADGHFCFIDVNGNEQHDVVVDGDLDCSKCNELTSLEGLPKINGHLDCSYCASLETAVIPDSIACIRKWAFAYCKSLKSIMIPDSITRIGYGAFACCNSLESIKIPDSVASIGGGAFYNCTALESITIPNSVKSIGTGAFSYCSSLTTITIPDSVIDIRLDVFFRCESLKSIIVSKYSPGYKKLKNEYSSRVKDIEADNR